MEEFSEFKEFRAPNAPYYFKHNSFASTLRSPSPSIRGRSFSPEPKREDLEYRNSELEAARNPAETKGDDDNSAEKLANYEGGEDQEQTTSTTRVIKELRIQIMNDSDSSEEDETDQWTPLAPRPAADSIPQKKLTTPLSATYIYQSPPVIPQRFVDPNRPQTPITPLRPLIYDPNDDIHSQKGSRESSAKPETQEKEGVVGADGGGESVIPTTTTTTTAAEETAGNRSESASPEPEDTTRSRSESATPEPLSATITTPNDVIQAMSFCGASLPHMGPRRSEASAAKQTATSHKVLPKADKGGPDQQPKTLAPEAILERKKSNRQISLHKPMGLANPEDRYSYSTDRKSFTAAEEFVIPPPSPLGASFANTGNSGGTNSTWAGTLSTGCTTPPPKTGSKTRPVYDFIENSFPRLPDPVKIKVPKRNDMVGKVICTPKQEEDDWYGTPRKPISAISRAKKEIERRPQLNGSVHRERGHVRQESQRSRSRSNHYSPVESTHRRSRSSGRREQYRTPEKNYSLRSKSSEPSMRSFGAQSNYSNTVRQHLHLGYTIPAPMSPDGPTIPPGVTCAKPIATMVHRPSTLAKVGMFLSLRNILRMCMPSPTPEPSVQLAPLKIAHQTTPRRSPSPQLGISLDFLIHRFLTTNPGTREHPHNSSIFALIADQQSPKSTALLRETLLFRLRMDRAIENFASLSGLTWDQYHGVESFAPPPARPLSERVKAMMRVLGEEAGQEQGKGEWVYSIAPMPQMGEGVAVVYRKPKYWFVTVAVAMGMEAGELLRAAERGWMAGGAKAFKEVEV